MDVEAEECTEEVQKGRSGVVDWTLKRRNARRKSKRNEAAWWIGLEAEECTEEVQKKKICTWKQPPGRRLFPQIEVIS